ncbi:MAG: hypothetical protein U5P41_10585 [Gammaproteobacteria bacterium]|nr:hypothetical protein [Gammaproteobacteria bacterium]
MTQLGYKVSYLDGGLMGCPSSDLTQGKAAAEQSKAKTAADKASEKLIDPDVRASAYEAEVAVSEQEMQHAESRDAGTPEDDQEACRI